MSWRAKLAERRGVEVAKRPDGELPKLTKGAFGGFVSTPSAPMEGGEGLLAVLSVPHPSVWEVREHLLALCADELLEASLVHGLSEADVAACTGLPDDTLRAYLRTLEREQRMRAGMVPGEYEATAHCDGCGPVHWHRPERLRACPWCYLRQERWTIPRPAVRCGDCVHYLPDPMNPQAGTGTCKAGHGARWPMMLHPCEAMQPT